MAKPSFNKKSIFWLLCGVQLVVVFIIYKAVPTDFPITRAFVRTWNAIRKHGDNFRRSVPWAHFLHPELTPPYEKPSWPQVSNKSVGFDIFPDDINKPFLLMIVLTKPIDFVRRHVIRTTWGGTHRQIKLNQSAVFQGQVFDLTKLRLAFVVGWSKSDDIDKKVKREAGKFGDILRVSMEDSYHNIVYKVLWAFSWATTIDAQFILKADNDVYINVKRLLAWLLKVDLPSLFYAGFTHEDVNVIRRKYSPYYVSRGDFSSDTFPKYCAGPCYIMTKKFLVKAVESTSQVKLFTVEDAYMGVLSNHLGVKPYHSKQFVWNRGIETSIRYWRDRKLSKIICIGDSLKTTSINFMHYRYMQL